MRIRRSCLRRDRRFPSYGCAGHAGHAILVSKADLGPKKRKGEALLGRRKKTMVERKSIALCIVLSLITCGLYSLYWMYCLAEDVNTITGRVDASGGMVLLLSIVTCGIYGLYWLYKCGDAMDRLRGGGGYLGILYLLLGLLGFGIISFALLQSNLNEYAVR